MQLNEYQVLANRTSPAGESVIEALNHAALGLATEAGEYTTNVKRMVAYKKTMTPEMRDNMIEELGDTLWYIALAATALGVSLSEMGTQNIGKLRLRFPDRFSTEAAEARADKGGLAATVS